eukprot:3842254-Rhodomonas_salina.1
MRIGGPPLSPLLLLTYPPAPLRPPPPPPPLGLPSDTCARQDFLCADTKGRFVWRVISGYMIDRYRVELLCGVRYCDSKCAVLRWQMCGTAMANVRYCDGKCA